VSAVSGTGRPAASSAISTLHRAQRPAVTSSGGISAVASGLSAGKSTASSAVPQIQRPAASKITPRPATSIRPPASKPSAVNTAVSGPQRASDHTASTTPPLSSLSSQATDTGSDQTPNTADIFNADDDVPAPALKQIDSQDVANLVSDDLLMSCEDDK